MAYRRVRRNASHTNTDTICTLTVLKGAWIKPSNLQALQYIIIIYLFLTLGSNSRGRTKLDTKKTCVFYYYYLFLFYFFYLFLLLPLWNNARPSINERVVSQVRLAAKWGGSGKDTCTSTIRSRNKECTLCQSAAQVGGNIVYIVSTTIHAASEHGVIQDSIRRTTRGLASYHRFSRCRRNVSTSRSIHTWLELIRCHVWRFLYNPCRRLTKLSPFEPGKIRDSCDAFLWRTNPAFNGLGVGDSVIRVTQTHPRLFQPPTTGEGVERSREHPNIVTGSEGR